MADAPSNIAMRAIDTLRPHPGNARQHSARQLTQIAGSIKAFGFTNPVLVADDLTIVAGHGRVAAARQLGMQHVPTIALSHLSAQQVRAYMLADNQLALKAGWDTEILAAELQVLIDLDFDMDVLGFATPEIDLFIDAAAGAKVDSKADKDDIIPPFATKAVTRPGDLWFLDRHRLLCGDAQDERGYSRLMEGERADMIFTDPPYNVPIHGHVSGLGKHRHREFAFASGEMSPAEFTAFLATCLGMSAAQLRDGGIAFVCMDWRHMREMLHAGDLVLDELKNLVVWNKTNAGMGSFYRSKHELIFVYKVGKGQHINNFGLGDTGRYRTNVWDYAGITSLSATRAQEQAMHPTCKPVRMVSDAVEDCSHRGGLILDCFGGSGTTLIAAHRCGRRARVIELDALYCDTIIRRFELATGKRATLGDGGPDFDRVADERYKQLEAA